MTDRSDASESSGPDGDPGRGVADWFLIHGDRRAVAATVVLVVVAVVGLLVGAGVLAVGPDGYVATLFGSGITAGLVTLLTVALSINQLILSRVFGSPDSLRDRLDGARELRHAVEEVAGEPASPSDPGEFLSLLARALRDRATALETAIGSSAWQPPTEVERTVRGVAEYGAFIDDRASGSTKIVEVLEVILGTRYAEYLVAVHRLQGAHAASLPEEALTEARAVETLLEWLAVTRQFVKTITLQQDFANLSRLIVYSGLVALLIAVAMTLVYRTGSVGVPADLLPLVVTLGTGVVVSPLALFVAYLLRAATIAHRTVSVGPFVPPSE